MNHPKSSRSGQKGLPWPVQVCWRTPGRRGLFLARISRKKIPKNIKSGLKQAPVPPFEAISSGIDAGAPPASFSPESRSSGALGAPKGPKTLREGPPRGRLPLLQCGLCALAKALASNRGPMMTCAKRYPAAQQLDTGINRACHPY